MKARKTECFYVYACHFWQVRVSKKEFYSVITDILQDQIYAELSEGVSVPPYQRRIPFVVEVFHEHRPDGSFHTVYILSEVYPYEPTGKDGYITRIYMDNDLIEERR